MYVKIFSASVLQTRHTLPDSDKGHFFPCPISAPVSVQSKSEGSLPAANILPVSPSSSLILAGAPEELPSPHHNRPSLRVLHLMMPDIYTHQYTSPVPLAYFPLSGSRSYQYPVLLLPGTLPPKKSTATLRGSSSHMPPDFPHW